MFLKTQTEGQLLPTLPGLMIHHFPRNLSVYASLRLNTELPESWGFPLLVFHKSVLSAGLIPPGRPHPSPQAPGLPTLWHVLPCTLFLSYKCLAFPINKLCEREARIGSALLFPTVSLVRNKCFLYRTSFSLNFRIHSLNPWQPIRSAQWINSSLNAGLVAVFPCDLWISSHTFQTVYVCFCN